MKPLVSIIMGSQSDWPILEHCSKTLDKLAIEHECNILSAHRTPDLLREHVMLAEQRGVEVFIAAAGGAAHLAGVVAAHTLRPVLGVPLDATSLGGLDSLLATVQMPAGIPVPTLAIGKPGAINAAIAATSILAVGNPDLRSRIDAFREEKREQIANSKDPRTTS